MLTAVSRLYSLSLFQVPDRVPWLYVSNRGVDRLEIEWYPISSEDAHGILLGYTVHYRKYNSNNSFTHSVNSSTRVFAITGLKEATTYQIKVTGRTSVGEGAGRYRYAETGMCNEQISLLNVILP